MKVDQRALLGIRAKVERAHDHLVVLGDEMRDFEQRKPYLLESEVHSNGSKHIKRFRMVEPIPVEWSVLLGEMVHDLRSALDQTVYWLTVDNLGHDLGTGTCFPIFTRRLKLGTEPGFADVNTKMPNGIRYSGLWWIRGVGPGPRAFIEKVQPYPQRTGPLPKALLWLNELWHQDKHRLVHLFGYVLGHPQTRGGGPRPRPKVAFWHAPWVDHDGAVAVRVTCDPPDPRVKVNGQMRVRVGLKRPGRHHRSVPISLTSMFHDTAGVCARLLNAIGHQEDPIDMGPLVPYADGPLGDFAPEPAHGFTVPGPTVRG